MSQTQHPDLGNLDQQGHLALDPALVKKVARLARLSPSEQELDSLSHELGKILEHFQNIEALDTDDVEPTYHPQDLLDSLRPERFRLGCCCCFTMPFILLLYSFSDRRMKDTCSGWHSIQSASRFWHCKAFPMCI